MTRPAPAAAWAAAWAAWVAWAAWTCDLSPGTASRAASAALFHGMCRAPRRRPATISDEEREIIAGRDPEGLMAIAPLFQRFVDDELALTPALIERVVAGTA